MPGPFQKPASPVKSDDPVGLLSIPYKGNRRYIHGTDLFVSLEDLFAELVPGCFVSHMEIRSPARGRIRVDWAQSDIGADAFGRVVLTDPAGRELFAVLSDSAGCPDCHPYDEELLVADAKLDTSGQAALLSLPDGFSTIEGLVALTKALCTKLAPPPGKWLFVGIDLAAPLPRRCDQIEIQLIRLMRKQFSVFSILIDGADIGSIRFAKDVTHVGD